MRQKWLQKPPLGTPINWSHPLAKGLVGFWAFQEGGGDLVNDLSGNANHGTLKNMAFPPTAVSGWNAGRKGVGLKFDGTDDYVDCGNDASLDITDVFSIEAWIKLNDIDANHVDTIYWATGTTPGYWFTLHKRGDHASAEYDNTFGMSWDKGDESNISYKYANIKSIWNNEEWHHVVGIYDGANSKLYLDGVESSYVKTYIRAFPSELSNTHTISRESYIFNGQIDQVRIYNRALSEREITDSHLDPFGLFERNNLWDYVTAPPVGAVMNQFQKVNMGADLYDGMLVI